MNRNKQPTSGENMKLHLFAIMLALTVSAGAAFAASENGRAGTMPAFYDDELFTINFKE